MSNELDIAAEREQIARDAAIADIQSKQPAAVATGKCLEFGAVLAASIRWCDNHCRDDWQRWNPGA